MSLYLSYKIEFRIGAESKNEVRQREAVIQNSNNMTTTEWKAYKMQFTDTHEDYIRLIPNN